MVTRARNSRAIAKKKSDSSTVATVLSRDHHVPCIAKLVSTLRLLQKGRAAVPQKKTKTKNIPTMLHVRGTRRSVAIRMLSPTPQARADWRAVSFPALYDRGAVPFFGDK